MTKERISSQKGKVDKSLSTCQFVSFKSVVTDERAKAVAKAIGAREYFETSAKTNTGVKEVFEAAARLAFESKPPGESGGLCDKCIII